MTHRASFQDPKGNNDFYNGGSSIGAYSTRTEYWTLYRFVSDGIKEKFDTHERDGYHPDCVICQDEARKLEAMPVLDIAALVAFVDDTEAPAPFLFRSENIHSPLCASNGKFGGDCDYKRVAPRPDALVTGREACPPECTLTDPRTATQKAHDLDDAETAQTRAVDYPM